MTSAKTKQTITIKGIEDSSNISLETFSAIARSLPDAICLLDESGTIIAANPATAKLLKEDVKALPGKNLRSFFIGERDTDINQFFSLACSSPEPLPGTLKLHFTDGSQTQCDCHKNLVQPASKNRPALIMMRSQSKKITLQGGGSLNEKIEQLTKEVIECKQAEAKIKKLNEGLEARVAQRTQELQTANSHLVTSLQQLKETQDRLLQADKMAALGNLVAGVAHEINTPIGVGVTAASYLEGKVSEYSARYNNDQLTRSDLEALLGVATESSNILLTNLKRAADLIQSFKQIAVDQSHSVQRQFDLKKYINETIISLKPELNKTQHRIDVDCPENLILYSYPGAYSQIITNLIMNSLIHAFKKNEEGEISITVKQQDKTLLLTYTDNGQGIEADNLKKIFDPFFTTRQGHGGSGLGMHVIFNLVSQTLGGKIECTSEPEQGVNFMIKIPNVEVEQAITTGDPESTGCLSR